jgi:hypothetical protein
MNDDQKKELIKRQVKTSYKMKSWWIDKLISDLFMLVCYKINYNLIIPRLEFRINLYPHFFKKQLTLHFRNLYDNLG